MSKKIVIIGGGLSAKHSAESLIKKAKGTEVTIVQANRFVEWPLAMAVCLVHPETHDQALATNCDKFQVPGVTYKYGVAESVDVKTKQIKVAGVSETVPYDALIVATGFGMPLVYPKIGVSLEDRKDEVKRVGDAIKRGACIVVAGGGPVGLELAGNIRIEYPSKRVVLLCRGGVLSQWPDQHKQKVEAQLKNMNIEVISGASGAPTEYSLDQGKLIFGDKSLEYDVFLPAYSQGPNTVFLESISAVLDSKKCIDVNEFLQSKVCAEIFAVGVSNVKEPFIGMPKLEAQWNTATTNTVALLEGKPLTQHKEGASFMKLPPLIVIGHGPKGYAILDFDNVPPPVKCCCCCGLGGFPCCPPCWPCLACAGCGCCPCGYCCGPPEGTGPATLAGKMAFKSSGMHFNGVGEAPKQQSME